MAFKTTYVRWQACNQGGGPLEIPPLEKCVGRSLQTLDIVQKFCAFLGKLFAPPAVPSWLRAFSLAQSIFLHQAKKHFCRILPLGEHGLVQVCTFHDGYKQEIDQQIFNRKSISRKKKKVKPEGNDYLQKTHHNWTKANELQRPCFNFFLLVKQVRQTSNKNFVPFSENSSHLLRSQAGYGPVRWHSQFFFIRQKTLLQNSAFR